MSVPSMRTVVASLRAEGATELAEHILLEAVKYKCPECKFATANPGIALGDPQQGGEFAGQIVFYCPWCSGEAVRPDEVP
jgi:hypothetical protein